MKAYKRLIAGTAAAVMLALTCGGCGAEKEPVTITIWNYYNGSSSKHSTGWCRISTIRSAKRRGSRWKAPVRAV
ncbi:hypothetical protein BUFA31_18880 [Butyricicoccus faecihominis]|uniref:ABC transporter substrate-binding protein n=1 Tax=Butyricicoccus faecihominis TaxID=1712515 RepID=A0ABQ1E162_9FIRM|nr:hypothetical protein BUFA31_18880 [Butyricicoccus faecihominis]GGM79289.1 hypothetical protein GCM10007040_23130 [Butyricicoccus faecihominis]